ncbi:hypothetical protein TELCIR_15513, partial [Teladorsagia circumcincta]
MTRRLRGSGMQRRIQRTRWDKKVKAKEVEKDPVGEKHDNSTYGNNHATIECTNPVWPEASKLLTIVVLILLDPTYVTAYISVNYEIVLIYIVSALTLLYCIVSVIMYFLLAKRGEETPLTNCSLSEVIFSTAGIMGWLIIIGIGGTISQRTIIETGERFGWIG